MQHSKPVGMCTHSTHYIIAYYLITYYIIVYYLITYYIIVHYLITYYIMCITSCLMNNAP